MKRFVFGLLLGLLLGSVATATAHLSQGYLHGWRVVRGGSILCRELYVQPAVKEIECE